MVLVLFFAFLLLGCTHERDNPNDPYGDNYSPVLDPSSSSLLSSSSLPASLVPCSHAAGCAEISAEACFAFGGMVVASCPASSSSHLLAEVSSSGGVSGGGSSSSGEAGSSSSIPEVMVLCRLSDGTCPLTLIPQEACGIFGGTPVQSCAGSSSSAPPSSSSIAQSSSSSALPSSSSVAQSSSSSAPPSSSSIAQSSSSSAPPSSSSIALSSSSSAPPSSSSVSAPFTYGSLSYEGQSYKTIKIGTQTWMAENLNYNVFEGSRCYGNDPANCDKYGSLHNWVTAMNLASTCNSSSCSVEANHRGICPAGWHIPSNTDWDALMTAVGGSNTAGTKLKAASEWSNNGNGTNEYGFSALPGGFGLSDGGFNLVGSYSGWWSATENEASTAYSWHMGNSSGVGWNNDSKSHLYSVRCLQD